MKIETQRLLIEPLSNEDLTFIIELLNQESFKKYIGERYVTDEKSAMNFLEEGPFLTYPRDIGMHCVKIKQTGEPVGLCGLMKRHYLMIPDLGYAFLEQVHGQGYAYEAAKEVINWAAFDKGYKRLAAMTSFNNDASMRLLKKLDFEESTLTNMPSELSESTYFELKLE